MQTTAHTYSRVRTRGSDVSQVQSNHSAWKPVQLRVIKSETLGCLHHPPQSSPLFFFAPLLIQQQGRKCEQPMPVSRTPVCDQLAQLGLDSRNSREIHAARARHPRPSSVVDI